MWSFLGIRYAIEGLPHKPDLMVPVFSPPPLIVFFSPPRLGSCEYACLMRAFHRIGYVFSLLHSIRRRLSWFPLYFFDPFGLCRLIWPKGLFLALILTSPPPPPARAFLVLFSPNLLFLLALVATTAFSFAFPVIPDASPSFLCSVAAVLVPLSPFPFPVFVPLFSSRPFFPQNRESRMTRYPGLGSFPARPWWPYPTQPLVSPTHTVHPCIACSCPFFHSFLFFVCLSRVQIPAF